MESESPWRRILLVGRTAYFVVIYTGKGASVDPIRYGSRAAAKKSLQKYWVGNKVNKTVIVKVKTRQAGRYIPYYVRDDELYLTRSPVVTTKTINDQLNRLVYREDAMKKLPTT